MMQEEKISYDEPKTFTLTRYKLYYSVFALIFIVGVFIFNKAYTSPVCFAGLVLFAVYLFFPFTYKLIISNEAISSINILGTRTLEWNEVAEIRNKNGNLLLSNRDDDIKVNVNQQIGSFPEVIKFVKQQRPDLWKLDDTKIFHQNIIEATILGVLGLPIIYITTAVSLKNGFSFNEDMPTILLGLSIGGVLIWQAVKIREIAFDMDNIVTKYLAWERRVHISEVDSVTLKPQIGQNEVSYPVHIKLKNGKQLVIEKVKEGNPVLLNAIEMWMEIHKGKHND